MMVQLTGFMSLPKLVGVCGVNWRGEMTRENAVTYTTNNSKSVGRGGS